MIKTKEIFVSSPTLSAHQACKVRVILKDRVRVLRSRIKAVGMFHTGIVLITVCKDEIQELNHIIEILDVC
jgi:glycine cleavage system regulatory protein